jgi:hypothetical protein
MSYRALGTDAECAGKPNGARCDARSHCDAGYCTCDDQYGISPKTGDCVSGDELCSAGTHWSALDGRCVIGAASAGSGSFVQSLPWIGGGALLGIGVLFLLAHHKGTPS